MAAIDPLLFTLLLAVTVAWARRLASDLQARARTSMFLLGCDLLLCAVLALLAVWLGLAGDRYGWIRHRSSRCNPGLRPVLLSR